MGLLDLFGRKSKRRSMSSKYRIPEIYGKLENELYDKNREFNVLIGLISEKPNLEVIDKLVSNNHVGEFKGTLNGIRRLNGNIIDSLSSCNDELKSLKNYLNEGDISADKSELDSIMNELNGFEEKLEFLIRDLPNKSKELNNLIENVEQLLERHKSGEQNSEVKNSLVSNMMSLVEIADKFKSQKEDVMNTMNMILKINNKLFSYIDEKRKAV